MDRTVRYVDYYSKIKKDLGIDKIKLLDNGSGELLTNVFKFVTSPRYTNEELIFESLSNLPHHRPNRYLDYGHCWRSVAHIGELINQGYKKIVMIDTDGYVCSRRLVQYLKNLSSGWTCFLSKRWNFPDSALSVLCEDSFPIYLEYMKVPWEERVGLLMERSLPYTHVEDHFNTDRYGEFGIPHSPQHDFYGQCGPHVVWDLT